jgi:hypothetical protein
VAQIALWAESILKKNTELDTVTTLLFQN